MISRFLRSVLLLLPRLISGFLSVLRSSSFFEIRAVDRHRAWRFTLIHARMSKLIPRTRSIPGHMRMPRKYSAISPLIDERRETYAIICIERDFWFEWLSDLKFIIFNVSAEDPKYFLTCVPRYL